MSAAVQSMLDRGLICIDASGFTLRALFTNKGLSVLRRTAAEPRAFERKFYWKLHAELAEVPEGL